MLEAAQSGHAGTKMFRTIREGPERAFAPSHPKRKKD
jgi:hypothetical protein